MQPESTAQPRKPGAEFESTECPNCHAVLPRGMRFCRACGYRLGEGLAEYVETVRLKPRASGEAAPPAAKTGEAKGAQATDPFRPTGWGAMAAPQAAPMSGLQGSAKFSAMSCRGTGKKRGHWLLWLIIIVVVMSVAGGGLMTPFGLRSRNTAPAAQRSMFGTEFSSEGGGAFMDLAYPPGGPADKAGLIGGDVVVSLDGQPVKNEDDAVRILRATPVGKTVDVVFIRDGQTQTTKLTTISRQEYDRLASAFKKSEKGFLNEGTNIDRVIVPGMNIYGVRLNDVRKSGPADMAGIKDGDIVIQFGDVPTRTRRELETRIERAQPYSTVTVVVVRDGQRMEIPVKVGAEP